MTLLGLVPYIQVQILFLPRTVRAHNPIQMDGLLPLTTALDRERNGDPGSSGWLAVTSDDPEAGVFGPRRGVKAKRCYREVALSPDGNNVL